MASRTRSISSVESPSTNTRLSKAPLMAHTPRTCGMSRRAATTASPFFGSTLRSTCTRSIRPWTFEASRTV